VKEGKDMYILSEQEFNKKYELYSQELMNISYGYTKSRDDSLDIIQNVFTKLVNNQKQFNNLNEEKYWLIRVTINECKDFLRKKSKRPIVNADLVNSFSNYDSETENLHYIADVVKTLPEKYRVVIILF
jgi:RNA polymerase sigma-70 factor (ECF subfamily)